MTNVERSTNDECLKQDRVVEFFVIRASSFIRHSSLGLSHSPRVCPNFMAVLSDGGGRDFPILVPLATSFQAVEGGDCGGIGAIPAAAAAF